jgi:1,4-dihydroxy-6-naphthoate synthase
MEPIRLAFSPDSDDIFMFWPLLRGKIDTEGLSFTAERADTETLNRRAEKGEVDVIAVSMGALPHIADKYLLLPHGASVGRGYGPVVVADKAAPLSALLGKRVGIPGERTTAYLILRLLGPSFVPVVVPIDPYTRAFESLRKGEVDFALLIHEGRLTFEREGFVKVVDIGEAWARETGGLPLPLGGNAIRRGLGDDLVRKISDLCRKSIAWSLAHRDEVMEGLLREENRPGVSIDRALLDRYLDMYANEDTREMKDDARKAIVEMFRRARERGLITRDVSVEFSP